MYFEVASIKRRSRGIAVPSERGRLEVRSTEIVLGYKAPINGYKNGLKGTLPRCLWLIQLLGR